MKHVKKKSVSSAADDKEKVMSHGTRKGKSRFKSNTSSIHHGFKDVCTEEGEGLDTKMKSGAK